MVDRLRRKLLIGVPAALALRPFAAAAQAPLRIEITEGVIEPMPFAAPAFVPDSGAAADLAARITRVVVDDLVGTGLFREVPPAAHIGRIGSFDAPVQFADWKAINAQALITGAAGVSGDRVQVRIEVIAGRDVCRLDVPASSRPIWAKGKDGDVLFERRNNSTRVVPAAEVDSFIAERFAVPR